MFQLRVACSLCQCSATYIVLVIYWTKQPCCSLLLPNLLHVTGVCTFFLVLSVSSYSFMCLKVEYWAAKVWVCRVKCMKLACWCCVLIFTAYCYYYFRGWDVWRIKLGVELTSDMYEVNHLPLCCLFSSTLFDVCGSFVLYSFLGFQLQ
jgi:hypothetical protein